MAKNSTHTVQFMYEFGLDTLTSHCKVYENEEEMNNEIKEWEQNAFGNKCAVFQGNCDPYDDIEEYN
jgi:hypothetical protein